MSCGRDGPASSLYDAAEEQLSRLPEGHMAEPLVHGCRGHLLYHCGQLQAAFEHLVQVGGGRGWVVCGRAVVSTSPD